MKLRTKISFLTIAIVIYVAGLIIVPVRSVVINAFRAELEKKAVSIAGNLSDRIANFILLEDRFQITEAFNEVMSKEPDLECTVEECKIGGLGIHLIRNLMDDICYERCGDRNVLTLKKCIKETGPE